MFHIDFRCGLTRTVCAVVAAGMVWAFAAARSQGAPLVTLHSSNVAIESASFSFTFDATTLTIEVFETWTQAGPGVIQVEGLEPFSVIGQNYTVIKHLTNNTGITWQRFANELLDPAGNDNDSLDPLTQPAFVPAGFSTSNDNDGLSFAQVDAAHPVGVDRISDVFNQNLVDELSDNRDFLDFFDGALANGATGKQQFGLRPGDGVNFTADNQPFLIFQRRNAFSVGGPGPGTGIPLPAAVWAGMGGIAAVVAIRRKLEKKMAAR